MAELHENTVNAESNRDSEKAMQEEWYDLLPVEKKLVFSSLALGVALLVVFVIRFGVFK